MSHYKFTVLEHHLDTFGHVNNATYLELFEEARWDLITKNGYGLKEIMKTQQGPVILEVNVKYLKELKLREEVEITIEMADQRSKIGKLKQQMIKKDGSIAAEAIFTVGFFDLKERKLIFATPEWRKAIGLPPDQN